MSFILPDFVFAAGYATGLSQYFCKRRRAMTLVRMVSSAIMIFYMTMIGAHIAAIAAAIAALGGFMQAIFPDHVLEKTLKLRLFFAVSLAGLAGALCARSASDILPLMATMNGRLAEVHACPQRIRTTLVVSQICWITYHFQRGYTLLLCAELLSMTINFACIWRFEMNRRKSLVSASSVA